MIRIKKVSLKGTVHKSTYPLKATSIWKENFVGKVNLHLEISQKSKRSEGASSCLWVPYVLQPHWMGHG